MNTFVSLLSSIELCLLACLRKQTQFDKISSWRERNECNRFRFIQKHFSNYSNQTYSFAPNSTTADFEFGSIKFSTERAHLFAYTSFFSNKILPRIWFFNGPFQLGLAGFELRLLDYTLTTAAAQEIIKLKNTSSTIIYNFAKVQNQPTKKFLLSGHLSWVMNNVSTIAESLC